MKPRYGSTRMLTKMITYLSEVKSANKTAIVHGINYPSGDAFNDALNWLVSNGMVFRRRRSYRPGGVFYEINEKFNELHNNGRE